MTLSCKVMCTNNQTNLQCMQGIPFSIHDYMSHNHACIPTVQLPYIVLVSTVCIPVQWSVKCTVSHVALCNSICLLVTLYVHVKNPLCMCIMFGAYLHGYSLYISIFVIIIFKLVKSLSTSLVYFGLVDGAPESYGSCRFSLIRASPSHEEGSKK